VSADLPSVSSAIRALLLTPDPHAKVMGTRKLARAWRLGQVAHCFDCMMPDQPRFPDAPELLPPNQMPRRRGGQTEVRRTALVHALAHIEFAAIDLALDMAGRFGDVQPRSFVDDWLKVATEESMHFALLDRRLRSLGSHYGALPAHAGLWQAAYETRHDVLARIAIVPLVLEARGLDVSPQTIARFESAGDEPSARIMRRIYQDEIKHVATGMRWFSIVCESGGFAAPAHWQKLVRSHFRGGLKAPFNDSARETAGLTRDYYYALASEPIGPDVTCNT
jgi:uncharacterized ferritin-like protein (DUF455 family)